MEMNRRCFLGGSVASVAAHAWASAEKTVDGGLAEVTPPGIPARKRPLVPAGAQSLAAFGKKCVGCQLCVAACPNGVLRPAKAAGRFLLPEMGFDRGWCPPTCVACASACPTGAIAKITPHEKRGIHIGHAVWRKERCLAVEEGVSCTACERHCPGHAIVRVPLDDAPGAPKIPVIDKSQCLGCGACEHYCPARPLPAIFVSGYPQHRTIRPMGDEDVLAEARAVLEKGRASCLLVKDGVFVAMGQGAGVAPLLHILDHTPNKMKGAWLIDRVIGRAAAALAVSGGAARIHGLLASTGAEAFARAHNLAFSADRLVPEILNRDKTGPCPLEAAVQPLSRPAEMQAAIRRTLKRLRAKKKEK